MENTYVEIKTYSKSELAQLYQTNVRTFMNWIKRNNELYNRLCELGYCDTVKLFTPEQVRNIFKYLGNP